MINKVNIIFYIKIFKNMHIIFTKTIKYILRLIHVVFSKNYFKKHRI